MKFFNKRKETNTLHDSKTTIERYSSLFFQGKNSTKDYGMYTTSILLHFYYIILNERLHYDSFF